MNQGIWPNRLQRKIASHGACPITNCHSNMLYLFWSESLSSPNRDLSTIKDNSNKKREREKTRDNGGKGRSPFFFLIIKVEYFLLFQKCTLIIVQPSWKMSRWYRTEHHLLLLKTTSTHHFFIQNPYNPTCSEIKELSKFWLKSKNEISIFGWYILARSKGLLTALIHFTSELFITILRI